MIREAKRQTERKLKAVRTDNAEEYIATNTYRKHKGAIHKQSPPYSYELNRLSERFNRTIYTITRSMLAGTKLLRFLWAEALNTAIYIKNHLSYQRLERDITLYKTFYNTKSSIEHLQLFERKYFIHILLE